MGAVMMIVPAVLLVAAAYGVMLYNGLVQLKHNVSRAWANIDVLLKQRHDELPKLVETCKQYMQFEQETLTRVMEARARVATARESVSVGCRGQAEGGRRATVRIASDASVARAVIGSRSFRAAVRSMLGASVGGAVMVAWFLSRFQPRGRVQTLPLTCYVSNIQPDSRVCSAKCAAQGAIL